MADTHQTFWTLPINQVGGAGAIGEVFGHLDTHPVAEVQDPASGGDDELHAAVGRVVRVPGLQVVGVQVGEGELDGSLKVGFGVGEVGGALQGLVVGLRVVGRVGAGAVEGVEDGEDDGRVVEDAAMVESRSVHVFGEEPQRVRVTVGFDHVGCGQRCSEGTEADFHRWIVDLGDQSTNDRHDMPSQ